MASRGPYTAWQLIAIASGACAALNGVFAKLTTDEITASWASRLASGLDMGLSGDQIDYVIRIGVFILFASFSSIMWGLFTRALSAAPSAVHVNIINTSANFVLTALLGAAVFGEKLPPLWWIGAGLLVAGSVIIGRREQATDREKKDS